MEFDFAVYCDSSVKFCTFPAALYRLVPSATTSMATTRPRKTGWFRNCPGGFFGGRGHDTARLDGAEAGERRDFAGLKSARNGLDIVTGGSHLVITIQK